MECVFKKLFSIDVDGTELYCCTKESERYGMMCNDCVKENNYDCYLKQFVEKAPEEAEQILDGATNGEQ